MSDAELNANALPNLDRDLRFFPLGVERPGVLTREQIERYNRDGYLTPFRIFAGDEMATLRGYFDDLLAQARAAGFGNY